MIECTFNLKYLRSPQITITVLRKTKQDVANTIKDYTEAPRRSVGKLEILKLERTKKRSLTSKKVLEKAKSKNWRFPYRKS